MTSWTSGAPDLTIGRVLRQSAERWPDRTATELGPDQLTFEQLLERSSAFAVFLQHQGLKKGDAVALQLPNCAEFLYAWFGASLLGAVTVPLNVHLRGVTLRHPLAVSDAKILVVEGADAERVLPVASSLPRLRGVVVRGNAMPSGDAAAVVLHRMADILREHGGERPKHDGEVRWSDPDLVMFTSGTTGPSKGVVASHHYLLASSMTSYHQKGGTPDDVFWTPLPLSHGNAMMQTLLGALMVGARSCLDEKFSVSRFWDRVRSVGATQVSILGSMITMIWNRSPAPDDLDNPARVLFGAPMPVDIHRAFEERFGVRFVTAYGMSEATPMVISTLHDPPPPGCAGRAHDRFDVRVFDSEDNEVPDGAVGEIVCRPRAAHVMFDGYLGDPAATQAVMRNLWLHTGDYGRRTPEGWFQFVDRKKDYVRRRGENVSSWEVEQALLSHEAVLEVAAFGVPSEVSEDDVMVAVVLSDETRATPEGLLAHAAVNLPYFAVPRYVEIVDELPHNDLGKVLKTELRQRGVTASTWDAVAAGFEVAR